MLQIQCRETNFNVICTRTNENLQQSKLLVELNEPHSECGGKRIIDFLGRNQYHDPLHLVPPINYCPTVMPLPFISLHWLSSFYTLSPNVVLPVKTVTISLSPLLLPEMLSSFSGLCFARLQSKISSVPIKNLRTDKKLHWNHPRTPWILTTIMMQKWR